jgi:E3 ubiquitin-protein ligase SHPRH
MPRKKAPPTRNDGAAAAAERLESAKRDREKKQAREAAGAAKKGRFGRAEHTAITVPLLHLQLLRENNNNNDDVDGDEQTSDVLEVALMRGMKMRGGGESSRDGSSGGGDGSGGGGGGGGGPSSPASYTHVRFETLDEGESLTWRLLTLDAAPTDGDDSGGGGADDAITWRAERNPGKAAATAFLALARKGLLAVRAVQDPRASCALAVGVTADALRDPPTHPEESSRRMHHADLRAALAWLAPPGARRDAAAAGGLDAAATLTSLTAAGEGARARASAGAGAGAGAGGAAEVEPGATTAAAMTPASPGPASHSLLQGIYRAARPPPDAPTLLGDFPQLVPTPRPYQRRAVAWMIRREQGGSAAATKSPSGVGGSGGADDDAFGGDVDVDASSRRSPATTTTAGDKELHPLWSELPIIRRSSNSGDGCGYGGGGGGGGGASSSLYINWYTGQLTRERFPAPDDIRGGILADEMGLGKTVELLLCVLAHKYEPPAPPASPQPDEVKPSSGVVKIEIDNDEKTEGMDARPWDGGGAGGGGGETGEGGKVEESPQPDGGGWKRGRRVIEEDEDEDDDIIEVENCVCGYTYRHYEGMWLACDDCNQWSHARCVGYTRADEKRHYRGVAAALNTSVKAAAASEAAEAAAAAAVAETTTLDDDDKEATCKAAVEAAAAAAAAAAAVEAAESTPPYVCGGCVAKRAGAVVSGPCGATLVVCPAPILPQWRSELARHAAPGAVKVVVYEVGGLYSC